MEMHWHWLIVIYLFLGGLGAGAYLTSFASEKGWLGKNSSLQRAGYYLAAPIVAFGTALLVFDLGQGLRKPWLLIGLLANFQSVMTWGVYILSGFIAVGLIKAFCVFKNKKAPSVITWAGAVLALSTCTYTGLLLWAVEAIPFWSTLIMPVLFVVSALSTGLSATAMLAPFIEKGKFTEGKEGEAHILLIIAELIVAAVFMGFMLSGANGPVGAESAKMLLSGSYMLIFWGFFIGLGLVYPLVVYVLSYLKKKKAAAQHGGHISYLHLVTDFFVLVGGFTLRTVIIFAALPLWNGISV